MSPEFYVKRAKTRRQIETFVREFNSNRNKESKFKIKATPHFIDRLIERDISVEEISDTLKKLNDSKTTKLVNDYLDSESREFRLEFNKNGLWIGTMVDPHINNNTYLISLRMAIVNSSRLASKISTKVINLK